MPKFLITYHGGKMPDDPAIMAQIKAAFGKWLQEAGKAVVDPGSPTRMINQVSTGTPVAAAEIGGYSIIEAASAADAEKILKSHPFVARGGTLQVNEVMSA